MKLIGTSYRIHFTKSGGGDVFWTEAADSTIMYEHLNNLKKVRPTAIDYRVYEVKTRLIIADTNEKV